MTETRFQSHGSDLAIVAENAPIVIVRRDELPGLIIAAIAALKKTPPELTGGAGSYRSGD